MKNLRLIVLLVVCFGGTSALTPAALAGPLPSGVGAQIGQREADIDRIEALLSDPQVIEALAQAGTDAETFRGRMQEMSDHDVHQLASRMDEIKGGGIIIEVLVIVLLVLVIIYFLQRT